MSKLVQDEFYIEALHNLVSGRFSLSGGEVTFHDGDTLPSDKEIQDEIDKLQYKYQRAEAYPSWQEQMDLIYHSGVAGLKAELKKTKDKYPKE